MTKQEFLDTLKKRLETLSEKDIKQYTEYYSEMIDDMVEDGSREEEAVASIGSPDHIAAQIISESIPSDTKLSEPNESRKLKVWEILLLALGSPIWFSLLIAAFAVAIVLSASVFAVIISFYAAAFSLAVSALASIPAAIILIIKENLAGGLFVLGSGLICASIAIFMFIGTNKLSKAGIKLVKKMWGWIKRRLTRKGNSK